MGLKAIIGGEVQGAMQTPQVTNNNTQNAASSQSGQPTAAQADAAIRYVTQNLAPAPTEFEQDVQQRSQNVSDTYDMAVRVRFPKPPEQMTYDDYVTAYLRAMFQANGLSDVTDGEIAGFQAALKRALGDNFGVDDAASREAATARYRQRQSANGNEAIWATNERGRAYVDAGMREIFRQRQARAEHMEQIRQQAQHESTEMLLDTGRVMANSAINLGNATLQLLSMQPEYVPGVRDMQGNRVPNPAVPQIPKLEYQSEMFRRDGQIIETGTTLGLAALSAPRSAPQAAPSVVPKGSLIVEAGRTLTAEESAVANILVRRGHTVRAVAESNVSGVRTADFIVDGVKTELKTISNLTGRDISASLSRRILDGAGQAPHIIMDVRGQAGMTRELAERAVVRAYGNLRSRGSVSVQQVRVIGRDFDITVPFNGSR